MSSRKSFLAPTLRSKSFSYGTLMDFSDDTSRRSRPSTSAFPEHYRSLTSYEDIDDEETYGLTETSLLMGKKHRKTSGTSTSSKKAGGLSQWITRITPPFLLPPDANLPAYLVRNGDDGGINEEVDRGSVTLRESDQAFVFSRRDKVVIGMIAAAQFCSTVVFSCIAPFFPQEAKMKGSTDTITGFVFGIFELVIVLVSPIFGRYLTEIGSNFMYGTGLCVTGSTAILFGLLNLVPAGTTFIAFAFVIRIVEAVGDSAIVTSSFAIVAKSFTFRMATIIGILETFSGLGFAAGPPIGGALYEVGGFQMPFMVLGSLLIVAGFISFCVLPKQDDTPTQSKGSIFHLLTSQSVLTMVFAIVTAAVSISFLDPTLQPHLSDFHLSPILVGLMFLVTGGTYAITAPFWGFLIDRKDCARWVMLFGCTSTFISLLFIGPSPIFPFQKQLWLVAVSLAFMGLGLGALFIPPFQQCVIAASRCMGVLPFTAALGWANELWDYALMYHCLFDSMQCMGYGDTFETYGLVSGLFQSSLSFGAFFGPTVGGLGVDWIGFPWTASAIALLHVVCATLIVCLMLTEKRKSKRSKRVAILAPTPDSVPSSSSPFASHHELKSTSLLSGSGLLSELSGNH